MCAWLDIHASAIQAICAVVGLIGLFWYCVLTRGIHQASLRQSRASIRPFLVIDDLTDADVPDYKRTLLPVLKQQIIIIRNRGNGPALDIRWTPGSNPAPNAQWVSLGYLAVGDWSHMLDGSHSPQMMFNRPQEGITIRFFDTAEVEHETVEECRNEHFYQRCRLRERRERY